MAQRWQQVVPQIFWCSSKFCGRDGEIAFPHTDAEKFLSRLSRRQRQPQLNFVQEWTWSALTVLCFNPSIKRIYRNTSWQPLLLRAQHVPAPFPSWGRHNSSYKCALHAKLEAKWHQKHPNNRQCAAKFCSLRYPDTAFGENQWGSSYPV